MATIKKEEWENLWEKINKSVESWRTSDGWKCEHIGKFTFDGYRIEWCHHYSLNYEGVPFNNLTMNYYRPLYPEQEARGDKFWRKEGSGAHCDIGKPKMKSLRASVEKLLDKEGITIE